jgi:hypothetical protein
MKLTKKELKEIIKEELNSLMEQEGKVKWDPSQTSRRERDG